jgi:hypothetical protein
VLLQELVGLHQADYADDGDDAQPGGVDRAGAELAVTFPERSGRSVPSVREAQLAVPGAEYAGWVQLWIWVPFVTLLTVYLFLVFPDGRLTGPRWRLVSWIASGFAGIAIAGLAFVPGSDRPDLPALRNPFGVAPAAVPGDAAVIGLAGLLGCAVLAAWSLFARARRGTAVERQQIKWLAYSGCLMALALVPAAALSLTPGTAARSAAGARLKDAVDLDSAQNDLASVVQKALEPAHVSVWISQRDSGRRQPAPPPGPRRHGIPIQPGLRS